MAKFTVTQWAEYLGQLDEPPAGFGRPQSLDGVPSDEILDVTRRAGTGAWRKGAASLRKLDEPPTGEDLCQSVVESLRTMGFGRPQAFDGFPQDGIVDRQDSP